MTTTSAVPAVHAGGPADGDAPAAHGRAELHGRHHDRVVRLLSLRDGRGVGSQAAVLPERLADGRHAGLVCHLCGRLRRAPGGSRDRRALGGQGGAQGRPCRCVAAHGGGDRGDRCTAHLLRGGCAGACGAGDASGPAGLAAGTEWGRAALLAVEHAPVGRRGLFGSFTQLGSPAGMLLATRCSGSPEP